MACSHPNRVITEYLSGRATHRWKDGKYAFSDELIELDRIVEECPDCSYELILVKGQIMPEDLQKRIKEARSFIENTTEPKNIH